MSFNLDLSLGFKSANSSDTQLNIDESPRSYAASQGSNDSEVGSHVLKLRPQCDLFGFAGF